MGAGLPATGPGITLPGAEYFALAPNRNIALGPRLASFNQSANVSVPSGTIASASIQSPLVTHFQTSSGLFIVRAFTIFIPAAGDTSSELQIETIRLGLQPPTTPPGLNIFLDIGIPLSILTTPPLAQVCIYERDALVTGLDLGPSWPSGSQLNLVTLVSVKNLDATNPHSFSVAVQSVYHSLEGFVQ